MQLEIERKYLVDGDGWRDHVIRSRQIRQGYIATKNDTTVRAREYKTHGELALKGATEGVTRVEYEYNIAKEDAANIIDSFCRDWIVKKRRYRVKPGDWLWEVDVFDGDNEGLILAEIELDDEDESFEAPSWIGREVSSDSRFRNAELARKPISEWSDAFNALRRGDETSGAGGSE